MKVMITGFDGYVGGIITPHLEKRHTIIRVCLKHSDDGILRCDLRDGHAVQNLSKDVLPDLVIHVVGNKDIGFCEKNPEEAFSTNCDSVVNISHAFGSKCRIIYLSTDYVFDGYRGNYNELSEPGPGTVYGKSKHRGETEGVKAAGDNFIILRLSALYNMKATFLRFLHTALSNGEGVECFSDIVYSPTYYKDFVTTLDHIIESKNLKANIFHSCGEPLSRLDFAKTFAKTFGFDEGLIKEAHGMKRNNFLLPNLSLNNERTRELLGVETTKTGNAIEELKQEFKKESF